MKPFPLIQTERMTMRAITESDYNEILFLRSNDQINEFIIRPPERQIKTKGQAITFIENLDKSWKNDLIIAWGLSLHRTSTIIGTICLWNFSDDGRTAEIGYDLHPDFQRKGYMSEAVQKVIEFGFNEKNLKNIEACTHKDNNSSKSMLERNGFIFLPDRVDIGFEHNSVFAIENL